jgi:hypothetical protein
VQTLKRKQLNLLLLSLAIGLGSGCGTIGTTEVVLVPTTVDVDGVPYTIVRLGEDIKARVYVEDGAGGFLLSVNRVFISAGWLLIPPPPPKGDDR